MFSQIRTVGANISAAKVRFLIEQRKWKEELVLIIELKKTDKELYDLIISVGVEGFGPSDVSE